MSVPFSKDLLSAYLDGELSPEELSRVEERLAENPELQAELAELRQVSERVRRISRPQAPQGFHADVISAIEQANTSVKAAAPEASPWSWARWRRRITIVAVCGVIAVGLRLMQPDDNPHGDLAVSNVSVPPAAPQESITAATDETEFAPGGLGGMVASNSVLEIEEDVSGNLASRLLPTNRVPDAGELLSYFDVDGDEPVCVEYMVADVQQAFGQVQLLLSRNGIKPLSGAKLPEAADGGNGLVAIYVEADDAQLQAVVHDIDQLGGQLHLINVNDSSADLPYLAGRAAEEDGVAATIDTETPRPQAEGRAMRMAQSPRALDTPPPPAAAQIAPSPSDPSPVGSTNAIAVSADSEPSAMKPEAKAAFQMPVENAQVLKYKLMVRQRESLEPNGAAPAEIVSGESQGEVVRGGAAKIPQRDSFQAKSVKEAGESQGAPKRRIVLFVTPTSQPSSER
ncbi:MAG: zf-HC2 domain-containing protein [Planctomycetaceae bacterium]